MNMNNQIRLKFFTQTKIVENLERETISRHVSIITIIILED